MIKWGLAICTGWAQTSTPRNLYVDAFSYYSELVIVMSAPVVLPRVMNSSNVVIMVRGTYEVRTVDLV